MSGGFGLGEAWSPSHVLCFVMIYFTLYIHCECQLFYDFDDEAFFFNLLRFVDVDSNHYGLFRLYYLPVFAEFTIFLLIFLIYSRGQRVPITPAALMHAASHQDVKECFLVLLITQQPESDHGYIF